MKTKTIPEISLESIKIAEMLNNLKPGEVLTYADMKAATGRDVQRTHRFALDTARKKLEKQAHKVYGTIRGVGVTLCNDEQKIDSAAAQLPKINRISKRAMRHLSLVESYDKLPRDRQTQHNLQMAVHGQISARSSQKHLKKLESKVVGTPEKLLVSELLNLA